MTIPVPDYLPVTDGPLPPPLAELALALYRRLAEAERHAADAEHAAAERVAEARRDGDRTLAALAGQHLEFERLLRRIRPELERHDPGDLLRAIDLFGRAWRLELEREQVEVLDVTGRPLSDELAACVEVSAAVATPGILEPVVRETLVPLVKHRGRVVGVAVINTSVPAPDAPAEAPDAPARLSASQEAPAQALSQALSQALPQDGAA